MFGIFFDRDIHFFYTWYCFFHLLHCVGEACVCSSYSLSYVSLRELFIFSLKTSIFFMRWDLRSQFCFPVVLGYPGFAVAGELGSDGAILHWLLLLIFLHLPFVIWLFLVLADLGVLGWSRPPERKVWCTGLGTNLRLQVEVWTGKRTGFQQGEAESMATGLPGVPAGRCIRAGGGLTCWFWVNAGFMGGSQSCGVRHSALFHYWRWTCRPEAIGTKLKIQNAYAVFYFIHFPSFYSCYGFNPASKS